MSERDRMAEDLEMVAHAYRHADGALPVNLADHLERAAALLRASPWRPWSELDPEEHGEVLVHVPSWPAPPVAYIQYVDGRWRYSERLVPFGRIHESAPTVWMPIPPPPDTP